MSGAYGEVEAHRSRAVRCLGASLGLHVVAFAVFNVVLLSWPPGVLISVAMCLVATLLALVGGMSGFIYGVRNEISASNTLFGILLAVAGAGLTASGLFFALMSWMMPFVVHPVRFGK